ncbi:hypothetical protein [Rhodovibrio salinarum]|uniref:Porin n=1 Tax=Rhodovibrio salinarum TaxID=1087 RepID=A0A934QIG6_9PROT|nr:hypothetical protein [Rhodovibrio salinarum]MBK1697636.1 hypothetical protein [Rhodovibrio salinarum]
MPAFRVSKAAVTALLAASVYPIAGHAEEDTIFPRVDVEIPMELENDYTASSEDEDAEINDLFATIEPGISVRFTKELSIESSLVFEPVQDPDAGDDRFLEDHGLYAEEIFVNYETERFAAYAGKFNPTFGTAWDIAPGIFGTDLAEDYEITERIGAGGAIKFGGDGFGAGDFGEHRLALNGFFADTTALSDSLITSRGELDLDDGGPSNTEDLSSMSATLDGGNMPGVPVNYHLGVQFQEGGRGTPEDQTGYVVGLNGSYPLTPTITLEPMVENAYFEDFGGVQENRNYLTGGASLLYGPWNAAVSYTNRHVDPEGEDSFSDDQVQVSAGYAFANGLTLDAGYKYTEDAGTHAHVIGALLTYNFAFSYPN